MTPKTVKLIAFAILLVHGIGHFQGVAAGLGLQINDAFPAQSWLLRSLSTQANKTICLVIFLITSVLGILTALSFKGWLFPEMWQLLAVITAILSTLCLLFFPNGFALFFNKIGAIGVNILIYYSIVFRQYWPSELFTD